MEPIQNLLNDSKARFDALHSEIGERAERLKHELEINQDILRGRLRDAGRQQLYSMGSAAYKAAAEAAQGVPVIGALVVPLEAKARHMDAMIASIAKPPIDDYDDLNVREVNAYLESLTPYEIDKVRAYEAAHKNRVTVLRAAEARLGA